ncbi:MAG TPA: ketol-acid reductoisomerase [Actinomycetota bacterium]|nr:ketol-acid reductoisomerase [Actinomycetota bacterium]
MLIVATTLVVGFGLALHQARMRVDDEYEQRALGVARSVSAIPEIVEAVAAADVVMVLLPDTSHAEVYAEEIAPHLHAGDMLMFAHGFSVHFGTVQPPDDVDVTMIAPKGPGHLVRRTYTEGIGTPALVAVQHDATGKALPRALAYGAGIGAARAGIIETTFEEETETDLFGEQTILCGGTSALVRSAFDTLVAAGYQPEIAYFECLHELKLIVDLIYEGGLSWMRHSISDTAEYGDYSRGPRIVNDETERELRRILDEIQSGAFAREWIGEAEAGFPNFLRMRQEARTSQLEEVGRGLRSMMPWLESERKVPPT